VFICVESFLLLHAPSRRITGGTLILQPVAHFQVHRGGDVAGGQAERRLGSVDVGTSWTSLIPGFLN